MAGIPPQQEPQQVPDVTDSLSTTTEYDTIWPGGDVTDAGQSAFEAVMLSHDKLYVVLAVVLIIWFGVLFFLFRTDQRLSKLEDAVEAQENEETTNT